MLRTVMVRAARAVLVLVALEAALLAAASAGWQVGPAVAVPVGLALGAASQVPR